MDCTYQAPTSMGFSGWEYWSGLPFPSPGIEPWSPTFQADALTSEPPGSDSTKSQEDRVWRASRLVSPWRLRENNTLKKSWEVPCPFPMPCQIHLFHLAVPETTSHLLSKMFLWVLWATLPINKRKVLWLTAILSEVRKQPGLTSGIWSPKKKL